MDQWYFFLTQYNDNFTEEMAGLQRVYDLYWSHYNNLYQQTTMGSFHSWGYGPGIHMQDKINVVLLNYTSHLKLFLIKNKNEEKIFFNLEKKV